MLSTRRSFTAGALSAALAAPWRAPAFGQAAAGVGAALGPALDAVRAYGNAHLSYFGLPGLTLGLTTPAGFTTTLNFGYANADARTPIGPETLFQIGSISKSMTAALIHQFAAAGRVRLTDPISSLLPMVPLPAGNGITLQNLLDHTAGLPDDAPMFVPGGLWTGFAPGTHWSYSNLGYAILGRLAEHLGGKPLDRLLAERIFAPLGMRRSRGAIIGAERLLYAQGYEAADAAAPFARGVPLAPAAWVDVTFGAGSVASTADDMTRWLRSLADAAQGRGGLGLPAPAARAFTSHFVPSDTPGMSYGNGLMHVANGARSYLHHTGGMVSFSSSFHVDTASGVGAFASSTISAFADYRPRLLTRFAVDALTSAAEGRPLPSPPDLATHIGNAAAYVGRYAGPAGAFEVRAGNPLTLVADGREAELQPWGGEIFRTTHPDFHAFNVMFERSAGAVTGAAWGPNSYARDGSVRPVAVSDAALARLAGRYVNDSPWWGTAIIVERGGKLWIGTDTPLVRTGENMWRVGPESWSPERVAFADFIDGRPQTLIFSGVRFDRHDI